MIFKIAMINSMIGLPTVPSAGVLNSSHGNKYTTGKPYNKPDNNTGLRFGCDMCDSNVGFRTEGEFRRHYEDNHGY